MGFDNDKQRRGFFGNLRAKVHEANVAIHEKQKKSIQAKIDKEQRKLAFKRASLERQEETVQLKRRLDVVKEAERQTKEAEVKLKKESFDRSNTGRFINATKRGVTSAVEFERTHAKGQFRQLQGHFKQLKKIGKAVGKEIRR